MINNDSIDTTDEWKDLYSSVDFFDDSIRSKLTSYKTTFTSSDIYSMINDRLFTKRSYKTIGGSGFLKGRVTTASGIDMVLFNELLDNGTTDNVDGRYWEWNGSSYSLKVDAVKNLPADEFLIFIQTHLGTFTTKPKKKWYQSGWFGIVFAVVIVVIAVLTQQYWLIGVGLGTTLVVAGMIISLTGALLGNEVMVIAGQIVSLVGGGLNAWDSIMIEQAAIESTVSELTRWGASEATIQAATQSLVDNFILAAALGVGKIALSSYTTINSLLGESSVVNLGESITPAEKVNEIYIADDISWDFVQQYLPDFIIANTLRIM
jgi:hypothetical protein